MTVASKKLRRHIAVREELSRRAAQRLARVKALAARTRMMIARLDRQLTLARRALDAAGEGRS